MKNNSTYIPTVGITSTRWMVPVTSTFAVEEFADRRGSDPRGLVRTGKDDAVAAATATAGGSSGGWSDHGRPTAGMRATSQIRRNGPFFQEMCST
jgi:hypothetical protein